MHETEIFLALFLPHFAEIGQELEARRVSNYLFDFKKAVPSVTNLRFSRVVVFKQHSDLGINLSIRLRDTGQMELRSDTGEEVLNSFDIEVAAVLQEITKLPLTLARALSPAISPALLRERDPNVVQIQTLRRIFLKRTGLNVFSGLKIPAQIARGNLFANGTKATISARVITLYRRQARLKNVSIIGEVPALLTGVIFSKTILMFHAGMETDRSTGIHLAELLDSTKISTMEVVVAWDSVSGQPHHLEFVEFTEPKM